MQREGNIREPMNLKPTYELKLFAAESRPIAGHDINPRTQIRLSVECGMMFQKPFPCYRGKNYSSTFILPFSRLLGCQVIYSQFGLAIHENDHQARRRFIEWAQNDIAVVPDFHKRILFSDEAHFWLNDYVNKQNCRIWSEANPQVYVETPLHPEKLTVWCALWVGGILLQKR
ncbi:hypothetical protein TNCV_3533291 [Trichonephila clavipes]|nr:hypothetical protein TNCV_3533291 [Trichonephila clavipes]